MNRNSALLFVIIPSLLACACAWAERDPDDIKRLYEAGEIVSLQAIIKKFSEPQRGGRVLEADLELLEDGRYVYEITILGDDGAVRELRYDARTGEFLKINEEY